MLVDLDLRAELDGAPADADLDFRLDPASSTLELRIPVDDGDVVAIASADRFTGVREERRLRVRRRRPRPAATATRR